MAYGVKYKCKWQSAMRERKTYDIEILENGYTGEVSPLYPTGEGLVITHGELDENELTPLRSSEAHLSLLCKDAGDPYLQLFTVDPLRYMLSVKEDTGVSLMVVWEGYLTPGTYVQDYAEPPYRLELRAVDGLAALGSIEWLNNGERFVGQLALSDIIEDIIYRISERRVNYPFAMDKVSPNQVGHTLSVVGLDADTIYSTIGGDEIPSCKAVLEAVLMTMQCQLFQSYTSWSIRPLTSLVSSSSQSNIIPLYADAGNEGVSTAATLSLLAPYRQIDITRPEDEEDDTSLPSMLMPSRWRSIWNTRFRSAWSYNDEMMRLAVNESAPQKNEAYGAVYVFDSVIERSQLSSVAVALEVYNLSTDEKSVNIGLLLCRADSLDELINKKEWIISGGLPFAVLKNGEWVNFEGMGTLTSGALAAQMESFTLTPAKRYIPYNNPVPVSQLNATNIDLAANTLGSTIGESFRLCLVIASASGVPNIELRKPTISVEYASDVEPTVMYTDAEVSVAGIGNIAYEQKFSDTWMMPVAGRSFKAPLINIADGTMIRGLVVPAQRQLLADVAVNSMRKLRGRVCRQIEGEVFVKRNIDLNTRWVDREGHYYYTNYVQRIARRGVYSVQLRQMPDLNNKVSSVSNLLFKNDILDVVGMDTSAMWLSSNSRSLYRYDTLSNTISFVQSSVSGTYPLTLNAGQRCASVVAFDGIYYSLYAYDTNGNVLSKLENVNPILMGGSGVSFTDSFVRSARFDANIQAWTLIGGDNTATWIQTLTADGLEIGRSVISRSDVVNVDQPRLITNGYAFRSRQTPTATAYKGWWHSFAHQAYGSIGEVGVNVNIVDCNEIYVVLLRDNAVYEVCYRTDTKLGCSAALVTFSATTYVYAGMNNALVMFRAVTSYGAYVYDGRTGSRISLSAPFALATSKLWISSDAVYCAWIDQNNAYHIQYMTIVK